MRLLAPISMYAMTHRASCLAHFTFRTGGLLSSSQMWSSKPDSCPEEQLRRCC